jgi:DNA (cytosine-5)-methyltransferase 1
MNYLSVCSGIEAATVAWHPIGWQPLAFSEIEKFPRQVLAYHYPDTPCHGDFTVLRDQDWIVDADLLVGGTPCQAFSVAGLRQSLSDDRGNLTLEFVRLADAIDNVRHDAARPPAIIVWENVPGVLSVKDNAFGCFLAALTGNDAPLIPTGGKWTNAGMVVGPKRSAAWRVLDAQYFGVAQRRRRVFVVASARDGFDPAEILFEREGVRRDIAPSRSAGKGSARGIEIGPSGGNFTELNPTLDARAKDGPIRNQIAGAVLAARMVAFGEYVEDGTASAMKARDWKDATDLVAQPIAIQDVSGREKMQNGKGWNDEGLSYTVDSAATQGVAQTMAVRRLTPRECERLQGFPDYYTAIPNAADGPRYKALGNSMAVPVMHWIGKRIQNYIEIKNGK